ncbi:MAG TPA: transposase [Tepidisphaeraceae bacterium]|nr:transposase [Tepidisphaeraceae bacterium]
MPRAWFHVIVNTRCSWLHGDPRGFRSREHRIHSSGDYRNPPPKGEHAGLHDWHRRRSDAPVILAPDVRAIVIRAFHEKLASLAHRVIAISCGCHHVHLLAELPRDDDLLTRAIGKCKQLASHRLRASIPGNVWSSGFKLQPIRDRSHFENAYQYIRCKQEQGTVVWSHRPDEDWIGNETVPMKVIGRRSSSC